MGGGGALIDSTAPGSGQSDLNAGEREGEEEEDLVGMKCQAPLKEVVWLCALNYHYSTTM